MVVLVLVEVGTSLVHMRSTEMGHLVRGMTVVMVGIIMLVEEAEVKVL
jgi:hypothetical protein